MDLYLDQEITKEAAFAARLSETPENWPQELTSELYKQLPFLSDYDVNVNLDRVEPNRGFAFGYADVSSKTERPEVEHEESGIPHIRIPLVIQERAAKPFSIFLDGEKVIPLTEERIREALFNPATFDISTVPPRDPSLVEPLMPPQRSGIGMGGEYKMASVSDEALQKLGYEIKPSDRSSIPKKEFAQPKKEEAGHKGKYPIPDAQHYRSALGFAKMHGDTAAYAAIKAKGKKMGYGEEKEKKSYIDNAPCEAKTSLTENSWLNKFEGSPLMEQAIEIEQRSLQHEIQSNEINQQEDQERQQRTAEQSEFRNEGDDIRMQKKSLELQLELSKVESLKGQQEQPEQPEQKEPLLKAIAPTINEKDAQNFTEKVSSDASLIAGFKRSGIAPLLVDVFENTKRASAEERLAELADRIEPTAITFHKLPGGQFLVKSANVNAFIEKTAAGEVVPQQDAAEAMGDQNAQAMQPGQSATAVSQPVPEEAVEPVEEEKAKPIDGFGQYKVMDSLGNSLLGHVFPEVLDWDGNFSPKPIALFTNGSAFALQEGIQGELVGKGTTLPDDEPRGDGAFYCIRGGDAISTAPVTVHSAMSGPDGAVNLVCSDTFGRQFQVSEVEGLKEPQRISDTEYALPHDWKFMRLTNQIELEGGTGAEGAAPEVKQASVSAELFFNGSFHLKGGCGLEKISTDLYQDMDPIHAEFMLGVLGVDGVTAKMKVAKCRKKGMVKLSNLKTITTLGERYAGATKTASALMGYMPDLRRDLTKIAANLEDEGTVDKLLALDFINPENLATFVGYLPQLEETSEHLAEMLLYSYLGQKEVPEGPVEHAMKSLEEVIVGLKSLEQS